MSALPQFAGARDDIALVLLGTGVVGGALLQLLATPAAAGVRLVGVANSTRQIVDVRGVAAGSVSATLPSVPRHRDDNELLAALDACTAERRVIVDATASAETAARHAEWLAAGYDVVTANKDAAAGPEKLWSGLRGASIRGNSSYGDAATVGAGLPVLSSVRRLRACGDRLLALEGVFSGSLSWLFGQYDGTRPFSALLREARAFGYTEPDPRVDLGGADVARKLVILARAAGYAVDVDDVVVESLVPEAFAGLDLEGFLRRADELDGAIAARFAQARAQGRVLRHLAALDENGNARVGLVAVEATHPAARLGGTDNLFALTTQRYRARPLVIQGPGAGAEVTAQALLGDLLALRFERNAA
jgi:aspartokinase/homoserine dehydrogenase 1